MLCFYFGHMTVLIGLISVDLLIRSSFAWTPQISESFKLPKFPAHQSHGRIERVVETEMHLFLRKRIIRLLPATDIKLDVTVHGKSHRFSLLPSSLLFFIHCLLHRTSSHHTMIGEIDQTSLVVGGTTAPGSKDATGAEIETASASPSFNVATQTMVKKEVPKLFEYWKVPMTSKKDLAAYHATGCHPCVMLSSTTDLDFPTIDKTIIVCFESHPMCGLDLPPSKFLISILNYLGHELIHLNPNAIAVLSCINMLCECWLGIPPNTNLF
jgi:hypothetical protein